MFNDLKSLRNNTSNKMKENVDAIEVSIDGVSLSDEETVFADDDMFSDDDCDGGANSALFTFLVPELFFERVATALETVGSVMVLLGRFKLVLKPGVTNVFGEKPLT